MNTASEFLGKDGIFAKKLKALMEEREISQQKLATAVGTTRQAIGNYIDGSALPTIEKLYKIAKFFDVSADYLLGLSASASSDIDERQIHNMLGLSERAIKWLRQEIDLLYKITNKQTPEEALDIQQKVKNSLFEFKGDEEKMVAYAQSLGVKQQIGKFGSMTLIFTLAQTPAFKTLNTLIEDKATQDMLRELKDYKLKDIKLIRAPIIEALENLFKQEKVDKKTKYVTMEYTDESETKFEILHSNQGDYFMNGDEVFSLYLLKLQKILSDRYNEYQTNGDGIK